MAECDVGVDREAEVETKEREREMMDGVYENVIDAERWRGNTEWKRK